MRPILIAIAVAAIAAALIIPWCARDSIPPVPALTHQQSGTTVRLQAISVVNDDVVWACGLSGTVVRTTNGGRTWTALTVPGTDSLEFRDIDAIDADTAYVLSSGGGDRSRIYKTADGGSSWTLQHTNPDSSGFYDCMGLWDSNHGAVYGDAVDGSLVILTTSDGENWERVPANRLPDALPGEGGFAASGTCLITHGDSTGWIATGASSEARILKTNNRGATWTGYTTPVVSGSGTSGLTSVGFHDHLQGIAAGGEIASPDTHTDNVAVSADGGRTWELAGKPVFPGAVYGLAVVPGAVSPTVVAVGPGGADCSFDNGATWMQLDTLEYWSVAFTSARSGWAVGPGGRITKIDFHLQDSVDEVN